MAANRPILLDLNNPVFQEQLFARDVGEVVEVLAAFKKLKKLDWPTLHKHKGFHWEDAGHTVPASSTNASRIASGKVAAKARKSGARATRSPRAASADAETSAVTPPERNATLREP